MRRRILVLGAALIATPWLGASLAAPSGLADAEAVDVDRIRLVCIGAMSTDGTEPHASDPANRISTDGVVDFANMRVMGFGMGTAEIVIVTPAAIGFGDVGDVDRIAKVSETPTATRRPSSANRIQGSIDRATGTTRIVVRPAADPDKVLIAMVLDCRVEPALR